MTIEAAHRETGDQTRSRIVAIALELIADHGFAGTSTREISERLGFTKAALYYHFRTKDDLLAAIVAPAIEDLAALVQVEKPRPGTARRRQIVAGYVDLVAAHADLIRVVSQDPSVRQCPALAAAIPLYERLSQLLSGCEFPDTTQRVRVRAALGGIHAAIRRTDHRDDPSVVRAAALTAACGALGIPVPRPGADRAG